MKFRSERDVLFDALSTAGRAIGGRGATSVVLSGVLLETEGNHLQVTGTDLDLTIRVDLEVIGLDDGSCVMPARLCADVVRSLEPGAVSVENKEDHVDISAARSQFSLRSFPAVEFPAADGEREEVAELDAAAFGDGLRQVVRAASNDDARPLLTGVLLSSEEQGLRMVATDSYRLAVRDLSETKGLELGSERENLLVPARALAEVQRAVSSLGRDGNGHQPAPVRLETGTHEVTFTLGSVRITSRLLDGTYPDYRKLIPEQYPNRFHAGKEVLLSALRRVKLLVRDNTTPVRLSMRSGGVDLSVTSQEIGDATETVDGDFDGTDLVIAFNPSYLIEGIEAVASDEVVIETAEPSRPATVRAADDTNYRYLLMPVRVS